MEPPRGKKTFAYVPRTLALVWRTSRAGTITLGAVTLAAALLPLAVAWAGKAIVDAVVAHDARVALRWVLAELGLVALQAASSRGLWLIRTVMGSRLGVDINVLILEKAQTLELHHFEDSEFYDQLTRARREASQRPISVVLSCFTVLQSAITLVGYAALLVRYSGWAVLGLLIATVPAAIAEIRFSERGFWLQHWRSTERRRMNYLEYVLANDEHAKEVMTFGLGPPLLGRFRAHGEELFREERSLAVRRTAWTYALSLFGTGAFYACYAAMGIAAAAGRLSLGELTLYVIAFRQGQQAFQSTLAAIGSLYEDGLYMSNLFAYLSVPTRPPVLLEAPRERDEQGIRFEKVGFRYPGQERWALREVSLFLPRGQSLALVGQNGAGKTTFIKLLTRLYDPTEGRILLDGKPLGAWDLAVLRRRIGVIFQDFNEYQLALRENVGFGSVEHLADEPRVARAVDRGGAAELVRSLGQGLETQLGRWFKDGVELSGGQWQKVALARAFMREEADVLVLDEPTAALDAEAEHAVFERFRALTRDRTTILISHRFPTVRMADRIVVLEDGRVIEEGTHAALVAAGARYAQLFTLQAQGYR